DGQLLVYEPYLLDQFNPFAAAGGIPRVVQIQQRCVKLLLANRFEDRGGRARDFDEEIVFPQRELQRGTNVLLIVGDEQLVPLRQGCCGCHRGSPAHVSESARTMPSRTVVSLIRPIV